MKDRDYGYFGKGTTGYAQYRTAFKRTHNQNTQQNSLHQTYSVGHNDQILENITKAEKQNQKEDAPKSKEITDGQIFWGSVLYVVGTTLIIGLTIGTMMLLIRGFGFIGLIISIFLGIFVWKLFSNKH